MLARIRPASGVTSRSLMAVASAFTTRARRGPLVYWAVPSSLVPMASGFSSFTRRKTRASTPCQLAVTVNGRSPKGTSSAAFTCPPLAGDAARRLEAKRWRSITNSPLSASPRSAPADRASVSTRTTVSSVFSGPVSVPCTRAVPATAIGGGAQVAAWATSTGPSNSSSSDIVSSTRLTRPVSDNGPIAVTIGNSCIETVLPSNASRESIGSIRSARRSNCTSMPPFTANGPVTPSKTRIWR